ncbi:GH25 family lysozyme [Jiangella ureilytica]|nr:GH25 family lysozyme [Jiangella ureilytica]
MRRRIIVTISAVVVGALGLGAAIWFGAVPHWRPALEDGERYGIDVSAHQGEIDWDAVAGDGIKFAYIKASEGQNWVDGYFEQNWDGAEQAGLERGAYHFFTLCAPGEEQAENFLAVAPPDDDALPPVIDLELSGNCSDRPPADQVAAEVDAFVQLVEEAWGRHLLFYVRPDWDDVYPLRDGLDRRLWDYRFFRRPTDERWHVWQVNTFARVDGIDGPVDLDIMRNDEDLVD